MKRELGENQPGFDESVAGVHNMVHLQVDGGAHDGHDQTLFESQAGGVHKLQQDGKALRVHLRVQTDGVEVALVGVSKECVEEPTVATGGKRRTEEIKPRHLSGGERQVRWQESYLQAMRTVLCARNCCLFTKIVTSVRMSLLRSRLRLSRTSLAWRVNCMQLSAAQAIFSKSASKKATILGSIKSLIFFLLHVATLIRPSYIRLFSCVFTLRFWLFVQRLSHYRCFSSRWRHLLNKPCLDFFLSTRNLSVSPGVSF